MAEIVRKDDAGDDIMDDARTALANAVAKGGIWREIAEERLSPLVYLVGRIDEDLKVTEGVLAVQEATIDAYDGETDDFLAAKADEMWNLVGCPGFDPSYSLIWPGGASTYTDGSNEEQPDRMELLADLLDAGIHPKLDLAWGRATAVEVRERAKAYREKLVPVTTARTKAKLLARGKTVLARAAHMELARLRKRCLAEGFSEAEVNQVIPDRQRAKPGKVE